jgi:hypothetical protein
VQPVELGAGGAFGGLRGAEPFEDHAALSDRDRLVEADDAHPGAPVRDPLDQPLGGQVDERGARAGPRDAERLVQLGRHQPGR